MHHDPLTTVTAWLEAANARDAERLIALSDAEVELAGPRGSARGSELLRDWLQRAGLHLTSTRSWVAGDTVVIEQHGVWRDVDTGAPRGEADLASVFRVENNRVTYYARYDLLDQALAAAGVEPRIGHE